MEHSLIKDIAICIVVAWLLAIPAQLFRQPLILAYLIAGLIIGPNVGVGLIKDQSSIENISGLGLILLLFMIGLEIDLKKMLSAGRIIFVTALAQILGCFILGLLFFQLPLFQGNKLDAVYLATACALSSTVIIIKILYEKRELDSLAGRITVGVLVMQDIFAILFLAVQPELNQPSALLFIKSLVNVVVLFSVSFLASRFILPLLFRTVARLPELVVVGALAWCFLVAGMAKWLGLSSEMGALIAGVAISTFPYTLDVTAKVTSLRDFFVTLYFVALGMAIPEPTWRFVHQSLPAAFALAAFVVATRFLTLVPTLQWMRQGHRASVLPAIHLSQISELSLVILTLGLSSHHLSHRAWDIMAYVFIFLAVVSSYAMMRVDPLIRLGVAFLNRLRLRDLGHTDFFHTRPPHGARIFLLGFSWTASSLLEEITRHHPEFLDDLAVIDFNPQVNAELKRREVRVIYGDISQRETLLHAGVGEAEIVVCSLPNTVLKGVTNLRLLQQLREINPTAQIIMNAELLADVPRLYAAGASYVSLPRVLEAEELCQVIAAARNQLLDEKKSDLARELENRHEVIP